MGHRTFLALFLAWVCGPVFAQGADVGLVDMVSGRVLYSGSPGTASQPVQVFMKIREGDRVEIAQGGEARFIFFESARRERWTGPASFRVGRRSSEAASGTPREVTNFPPGISQRIAQVPDILNVAKSGNLGGVQVRGLGQGQARSPQEQMAIDDARAVYQTLRRDEPPDGIAPELYLVSVLSQYRAYGEMKPVVDEMLARQPGNEDIKALAAWVNGRIAR